MGLSLNITVLLVPLDNAVFHICSAIGFFLVCVPSAVLGVSIGLQTGKPGFDAPCLLIHSEYTQGTCSLNHWDLKVLWTEPRVKGSKEYSPSVPCINCGDGDRWYCHLSSLRDILQSEFVWCSRPWPTTDVLLDPCHNEFRGPRSDYVRQLNRTLDTARIVSFTGKAGSRRVYETPVCPPSKLRWNEVETYCPLIAMVNATDGI
ncbi:uncharacterized protein TNCV_351371 [Trichonephila clavipes]|nr:uncharacterized protein TNCV_351371 [Trichonephila clavipes]